VYALSPKISEERRQKQIDHILEAARRCFVKNGYHVATVDDIVEESGLSKGAIYNYFESKEQIFLELAERTCREDVELMSKSFSPEDSAWRRLTSVWHEIIRSWRDVDEWLRVRLEFWLEATKHPRLRQVLDDRRARYDQVFIDILNEGIRRGEFLHDIDVIAVTRIFWAIADGFAAYWLVSGGVPSDEELLRFESAISDVLAGIVGCRELRVDD